MEVNQVHFCKNYLKFTLIPIADIFFLREVGGEGGAVNFSFP